MSLRPTTLDPVKDYPIALKPTLGYEQQLYVSTSQSVDLGTLELVAANSGTYTRNNADNLALASAPAELLLMLKNDVNCGASDLVVTVNGTDANDAPLTGTATFSVPAYAQETTRVFPKGYAAEVIPGTSNAKFKTILSVSPSNSTTAVGVKLELLGVPSLTTYRLVGCKTQLNYDPKVPQPVAVQCGRDVSAFIKAGEIPAGELDITAKIPTYGDGLARLNGIRVTGLIKEKKEDKVTTLHVFLLGLIMTSKATVGESTDPATLSATAKYEEAAFLLAP